jgi:hypothetical protein
VHYTGLICYAETDRRKSRDEDDYPRGRRRR